MLTLPTLLKGFQRSDYNRLLRGLEAGGLPLPEPLRARLRRQPVVVLALLARRATELAYGPCRELHQLADALLARQRPDGGFGNDDRSTPDALATAAGYAALTRLVEALPGAASIAAEQARERAEAPLKRTLPMLLAELAGEDTGNAGAPAPTAAPTATEAAAAVALAAFLLSDTPHLLGPLHDARAIERLDAVATRDPQLQSLWQMARLSLPCDPTPTTPTQNHTPQRWQRG